MVEVPEALPATLSLDQFRGRVRRPADNGGFNSLSGYSYEGMHVRVVKLLAGALTLAAVGVMVAPATPASAASAGICFGDQPVYCVGWQTDADNHIRAMASLEDKSNGDDTVAVVAYLDRWDGKKYANLFESPRVEGNNYVLAVTAWACGAGNYRLRVNWNWRHGALTGSGSEDVTKTFPCSP
jgi:hypothetical protein